MHIQLKEVWHSNDSVYPVVIIVDGIARERQWLIDNNVIVVTKSNHLNTYYKVNTTISHYPFNRVYTPQMIEEMNKVSGISPDEWAGISYKGIGFTTSI